MVARINTSKNISKALNYNEQKLKSGAAEILSASGFLKEADKLTFFDKINHFDRLISLNDRTVTNTLHVSLNFDPSENLPNEKLIQISESYMEQIGFGDQPYLVYNHTDAGHPHIHIVSVNIKKDGKRISMHNMGRNQSETARKNIEVEFNLIKAGSRKNIENLKPIPVNAQKVNYGKSATKRAIANVLMSVLNNYKYTSLPELNAVLKFYNVSAETGQPGTLLNKNKGLIYRAIDNAGNKIGTPIKASAFYMKPTLPFLEKKFLENQSLRSPFKKRLQASIIWKLNKKPATFADFISSLEKDNINVVVRSGKDGVVYGLTYIDHKTRTVFNGSDLGKQYSANAIVGIFGKEQLNLEKSTLLKVPKKLGSPVNENKTENADKNPGNSVVEATELTISKIIPAPDYIPYQWKKKKRKKRKQISN